jgi:hypothetical protein
MSFNLDFWKLLAGLGIFLFGMLLIEESVKALSGKAETQNRKEATHVGDRCQQRAGNQGRIMKKGWIRLR